MEHDVVSSFAVENKLMFYETSARSAKNVQEIYLAVAKKLKQLKELHVHVQPTPKKSNCC